MREPAIPRLSCCSISARNYNLATIGRLPRYDFASAVESVRTSVEAALQPLQLLWPSRLSAAKDS